MNFPFSVFLIWGRSSETSRRGTTDPLYLQEALVSDSLDLWSISYKLVWFGETSFLGGNSLYYENMYVTYCCILATWTVQFGGIKYIHNVVATFTTIYTWNFIICISTLNPLNCNFPFFHSHMQLATSILLFCLDEFAYPSNCILSGLL